MKCKNTFYSLILSTVLSSPMASQAAQADIPHGYIAPINPIEVFNNPDPSQYGIYDLSKVQEAIKVQEALQKAQAAKALADAQAKMQAAADAARSAKAAADAAKAAQPTTCQILYRTMVGIVRFPLLCTVTLLNGAMGRVTPGGA